MAFRAECSAEEWLAFTMPFFGMFFAVAKADGSIDGKEEKLLRSLREGREAKDLLSKHGFYDELNARPDLAREVLAMDDSRVLATIDSGADDPFFWPGRLKEALDAFVSRDRSSSEEREACARGLRFEVMHFGMKVALASSPMFGRKVSDEEGQTIIASSVAFDVSSRELATIAVLAGAMAGGRWR